MMKFTVKHNSDLGSLHSNSRVTNSQQFKGTYCFHLQGSRIL